MAPLQRAIEPFRDLVEESLDEASFLWQRWEGELTSLTRSLDEVWSWTEDRLHGALDGVRVGGSSAIDLASAGLHTDEHGRISACAALLASSPDQAATSALVDALTRAEGEALAAMIRGLELLGSDHTLRAAARTLAAAGPRGAGALCRLKAFRRAAVGDELLTAFESDDTPARCDAVRAALHGQVERAERVIVSALRDDEPLVRAAAIEAGVAGGIREAWDEATRLARSQEVSSGGCLKLVAMLGTADDHEAVYASLRKPPLQRDAIWALGHIGTIRAAEACLAGMQHEPLARASGEAYCWITGADLVRDRLAADEAPHDAPPFEEDDLDADLVPSPETLWPLPDPDAVRRDWLARRPRFIQDARHIQGRPATTDTLLGLIETGPMLRRPDLILELRARTRGRYDVEPRAFAARQRRMMVAGRTAASGLGR